MTPCKHAKTMKIIFVDQMNGCQKKECCKKASISFKLWHRKLQKSDHHKMRSSFRWQWILFSVLWLHGFFYSQKMGASWSQEESLWNLKSQPLVALQAQTSWFVSAHCWAEWSFNLNYGENAFSFLRENTVDTSGAHVAIHEWMGTEHSEKKLFPLLRPCESQMNAGEQSFLHVVLWLCVTHQWTKEVQAGATDQFVAMVIWKTTHSA